MKRKQEIRPRDEASEMIECYIQKEGLVPHDKLPSERAMCQMWNLNRSTLRVSIKRLTEEGKLYSIKGSGTFVAPIKLERNLQDVKSASECVRGAGRVLKNKLLDAQIIECNKYLSRKLQIPLGYKIFYLKRVRIMNGIPYSVETCYIDYQFCPRIETHDFADESLYSVLNDYGINLTRGSEQIGITFATEHEAKWLNISEGDALFYLSGTSATSDGKPIELFKSVVRSDQVRFLSILKRNQTKGDV